LHTKNRKRNNSYITDITTGKFLEFCSSRPVLIQLHKNKRQSWIFVEFSVNITTPEFSLHQYQYGGCANIPLDPLDTRSCIMTDFVKMHKFY